MLSCPNLNSGASSLYSDLAMEFKEKGHKVTILAPSLENQSTQLYKEGGLDVLRVNVRKSEGVNSIIKKGIALSLMPFQYKRAYRQYLKGSSFDLIIMHTPPITLIDFANYVKKKTNAKLYLILRDIHPHSLRSIGMCNNPLMYNFLFSKAQKAYKTSDYIGCMSPANIDFTYSISPNIDKKKVVLLPNWQIYEEFIPADVSIREKYGLENKFVSLFGGTIGAGQAVWNIIKLAKHYKNNSNIIFLVVGKGIRKQMLIDMAKEADLSNILFLDFLPRDEYNDLLKSADIGIISLDERYKVPTCPSKIIGYMAMKIPVLAMINKGSDYGQFYIDRSGVGLWSDGANDEQMYSNFDKLYKDKDLRNKMGESGYNYYINNLTSEHTYELIMSQLKN